MFGPKAFGAGRVRYSDPADKGKEARARRLKYLRPGAMPDEGALTN
jgi:hypothetical protein